MKKPLSKRRIILAIFLVIFIIYAFTHYKELLSVADALSQGSYRWLFAAAVSQVVYYYVFTRMTQKAFETVNIKRSLKDLYPLVLGALFVNVLAPTGGNSGTILFADDAARRKESSTTAVVGYMVSIVSSYTSFFTLLIFAIIFLQRSGLLNPYEVTGATLFVFPVIIPTFLLFMAAKKPSLSSKFLSWIGRVTNKFFKLVRMKKRLESNWATRVNSELKTAATTIFSNSRILWKTIGIALLAHALNIVSLYLVFIAFDVHIHYGALIAGYVFAEVIRVISPHPEGVGAVEAVIVLIFTSFGVTLISATAIAITFRALNFWAPLGLGFFYLQRLKSFSKSE